MDQETHHSFSWLRESTAEFGLDGCQVDVLSHPHQFYEALKFGIENAEKRVVLASLYLGTGDLEATLVNSLFERCQQMEQSNVDFKVKILLDFTRGSRGDHNSRTMLLSLLQNFTSVTQIALYHSPDLRGLLKRLLPDRFNETIGVSHLKVYLFDDTVIMSGANLSNDYFTNRQDRYIVIRDCPELANYLDQLVTTVSEFSFQLQTDDSVSMPEDFPQHPFEDGDDGTLYKHRAGELVSKFLEISSLQKCTSNASPSCSDNIPVKTTKVPDTWIYPLVQMAPLGIDQDEVATKKLFTSADINSKILLASGYFNLTEDYQNIILNSSKADYDVLMASPQAMGFFGARGAAGAVPQAYTYYAKHFFEKITRSNTHDRILLSEYSREKWTFHVKGLWYYLPNTLLPSLTLIGSPNLGNRSVHKDLECQVAIVTQNKSLQEKLHQEQLYINEYSSHISRRILNGRHVQTWAKLFSRFFRSFF